MTTNTSDPSVTSNTPSDNPGMDSILGNLVGEGKKFKSIEDLARGKIESDSFIDKLQEENNALRALIRNSDDVRRNNEAMTEILNRVSRGTLAREPEVEATRPSNGGQPSNQSQPSLTSRDVELVYKQMRQREREDANEQQAMQKIAASYGDQSETFLTKKASELGLDAATLKAMARQSPLAFLNLVGETQTNKASSSSTSPRGSVNTAAVTELTGTSGLRNKQYYDKLKKEMGTKTFVMDRNLQVQMHKDMQSLGDQWDAA